MDYKTKGVCSQQIHFEIVKKEETAPLKRKHPFAQTFRSSRNVTEKRKYRNITKKVNIEA